MKHTAKERTLSSGDLVAATRKGSGGRGLSVSSRKILALLDLQASVQTPGHPGPPLRLKAAIGRAKTIKDELYEADSL